MWKQGINSGGANAGVLAHAQSEDRARSNEMGELELRATCLEYLMARGGL